MQRRVARSPIAKCLVMAVSSLGPGNLPGRGTCGKEEMSDTHPIVEMRGIRKAFGPTEVLHGVDFMVLPGEVHVLAGENGAGKSTLIKILSGVYGDFSGELRIEGRKRRFLNPNQAVRSGIAAIHQELSLVPSMSVSDNLFLGQERSGTFGQVDFKDQEVGAARILKETELDLSPHQLVEDLSIAGQQTLEIARALAREASVVVFDEPTSALGEQEVEGLFRRILELRGQGKGIVYITHRMEEIYRLADRITVLRDGELVGTAPADRMPPEELVRLMVGRDLAGQRIGPCAAKAKAADAAGAGELLPRVGPAEPMPGSEVILEAEGLRVTHPHTPGRFVVDGVGFSLRKGEVLGLAGLEGSGKSEVLHALFGALEGRAWGKAILSGRPLPLRDPRDSVDRGLVLLTNDRKAKGLAPDMGVTHNVSLASLGRFTTRSGWMDQRAEGEAVESLTRKFRLKAPSMDAPVRTLSGGNQQKAYLARCLLPDPRVLLLDEPTRGVDVGAKADIYGLMGEWTHAGIAILLITSEMDELLSLSHRILVMHRGRVTAEFPWRAASKDTIMAAAMGQMAEGGRHGSPAKPHASTAKELRSSAKGDGSLATEHGEAPKGSEETEA
jgi:ABC-type sugar transport system ATPase subunit